MLNNISPRTGNLLISEPFLSDPNFSRAVILLAEYDAQGVVGFVLNQTSQLLLKDLVPDLVEGNFLVHIGGPVEVDTIHFIHRCYDKLQSGEEIAKGVYWGGDFETLKLLINNDLIKDEEIKFFLGYSGWDKQQLSNELKDNTWIVAEKYNQDLIFSTNDDDLWREVVIGLGTKYAHVSNFPLDPSLN